MRFKSTGLAALALAAALVLAGCSAGAAPAAETAAKPAKTATATPTQPADPLAGKKSGDAIDAELAAMINASSKELTDDRAFPMPDGTFVLLKGGEPAPENVKQAIASTLKPLAKESYQARDWDRKSSEAYFSEQRAQTAATGRNVTYVTHVWNAMPTGGWEPRWSTDKKTIGSEYNGTSKEKAIAVAQSWVDKSPTTRMLIVIDIFE